MFRIKLFAGVLAVFLALDALWLGVLMAGFYKREMWALARKSGDALAPYWTPALVVYFVIPLGLVLFVYPLVSGASVLQAALWGALFGVVVYATYDCTNLALLEGWSRTVTIVDIAWGATICAISSMLMQQFGKWLS